MDDYYSQEPGAHKLVHVYECVSGCQPDVFCGDEFHSIGGTSHENPSGL